MNKFSVKNISCFVECWDAKIDILDFSTENLKHGDRTIIKFTFTYDRDKFAVILKSVNENDDFKGEILCNNKKIGFCDYTIYKSKNRRILFGSWIEDGEKYPSVIELIK